MTLRPLEPSLQERTNSGILKACERFAIDVGGRTEFIFDTEAPYTRKKLAASTLDAYVEYYWIAWQFFASAGYYESLLPLVKGPPLPKPFPAMQVEALKALLRHKCLPMDSDENADAVELLHHVVNGEVINCTNEWTEKDADAFTSAISRLHRAAGHRVDRSPSQVVCDACLENYRAAGGDRTLMEPCQGHRSETTNPPILRWGDPTRTTSYHDALRSISQDPNTVTAQPVEHEEDNAGNNLKIDWIFEKLSKLPISSRYPDLLDRCRPIVEAWHAEFSVTQPPVWWSRMRRNLPKELNESAFILDELLSVIDGYHGDHPVTIIDMCSGVGYLSMFLSHLLPPSKVSRIVAVDILFQSHIDLSASNEEKGREKNNIGPTANGNDNSDSAMKPQSHHLQTSHLISPIHPITIRPRRANIKKGRELRQIAEHCVAQAPGAVIILGIHLCKSLSVHTVRLFNTTSASHLYLKPCCLPGRRELGRKHPPFWAFDQMEGGGFGVKTLYCQEIKGKRTDASAGMMPSDSDEPATEKEAVPIEHNGHHHSGVRLFSRWVTLLRDATRTAAGVTAEIHHLPVQARGFQNQFIVAKR